MSLTSDDLADIKQMMQSLLVVQEKQITDNIMSAVNKRFDEQDEKLDTILDAVGARFEEREAQLDDHETRITKLERRAV